jgi:hypothetical protein
VNGMNLFALKLTAEGQGESWTSLQKRFMSQPIGNAFNVEFSMYDMDSKSFRGGRFTVSHEMKQGGGARIMRHCICFNARKYDTGGKLCGKF